MSFVTRRALSTLIPPKVASPSVSDFFPPRFLTVYISSFRLPPHGLGAAKDAARMQRVVSFYEKLPRGPAPEVQAKGLLGRYQAKYFGKNPSAAPIIHALVVLVGIGYAQNYYFHLRKC
ncbi:hypothetical protein EYC80_001960 [Monilinia laxa]|uniref:Uncharacterized protein n=1 Tax=Monilinia laxa TaxID=61186 RepID=A0A5N6K6N0_MONLA|nr:hypothetical protein EYC80_001960 [Monilinia laxa]